MFEFVITSVHWPITFKVRLLAKFNREQGKLAKPNLEEHVKGF